MIFSNMKYAREILFCILFAEMITTFKRKCELVIPKTFASGFYARCKK